MEQEELVDIFMIHWQRVGGCIMFRCLSSKHTHRQTPEHTLCPAAVYQVATETE